MNLELRAAAWWRLERLIINVFMAENKQTITNTKFLADISSIIDAFHEGLQSKYDTHRLILVLLTGFQLVAILA